MNQQFERDDPNFIADLHESQGAVWRVAQWLSASGRHVTVRAVRVRPNVEEMHAYADDGDIEVIVRLEVKQRKLDFTCAADYPYPTVTVDVAHAWDHAIPKPLCYFIVNRARTVVAMVPRATAGQWLKVTKHDRFKNRERTFYECPVALVRFQSLAIPMI